MLRDRPPVIAGAARGAIVRPPHQHEARACIVMSDFTLVIGNKNYSSWSLRPWLALRHAGIPFDERLLLLFDENWKEAIGAVSPSARVPRAAAWRAHRLGDAGDHRIRQRAISGRRSLARGPRCPRHSPRGRQRDARGLHRASQPHAHEPAAHRTSRAGAAGLEPRVTSPASARSGAIAAAATAPAATSCSAPSARPTPCMPRWSPGWIRTGSVSTRPAPPIAAPCSPCLPSSKWRDAALQEPWIVPEDEID